MVTPTADPHPSGGEDPQESDAGAEMLAQVQNSSVGPGEEECTAALPPGGFVLMKAADHPTRSLQQNNSGILNHTGTQSIQHTDSGVSIHASIISTQPTVHVFSGHPNHASSVSHTMSVGVIENNGVFFSVDQSASPGQAVADPKADLLLVQSPTAGWAVLAPHERTGIVSSHGSPHSWLGILGSGPVGHVGVPPDSPIFTNQPHEFFHQRYFH